MCGVGDCSRQALARVAQALANGLQKSALEATEFSIVRKAQSFMDERLHARERKLGFAGGDACRRDAMALRHVWGKRVQVVVSPHRKHATIDGRGTACRLIPAHSP